MGLEKSSKQEKKSLLNPFFDKLDFGDRSSTSTLMKHELVRKDKYIRKDDVVRNIRHDAGYIYKI